MLRSENNIMQYIFVRCGKIKYSQRDWGKCDILEFWPECQHMEVLLCNRGKRNTICPPWCNTWNFLPNTILCYPSSFLLFSHNYNINSMRNTYKYILSFIITCSLTSNVHYNDVSYAFLAGWWWIFGWIGSEVCLRASLWWRWCIASIGRPKVSCHYRLELHSICQSHFQYYSKNEWNWVTQLCQLSGKSGRQEFVHARNLCCKYK